MTSRHIQEIADSVSKRFSISLDVSTWSERAFEGGIAFVLHEVEELMQMALGSGDVEITAYELESLEREFPPQTFSFDPEGMKAFSNSWMAHFDVVLIPPSKTWAIVTTPDMRAFVMGPEERINKVGV